MSISETEDTPRIEFDKTKNVFEISGRSLPENAVAFYAPVREWLENYVLQPNPLTEFAIKLDYFNSSSAKQIVQLLKTLHKIERTGSQVKVVWYCNDGDEVMQEKGLEMKKFATVSLEVRTY